MLTFVSSKCEVNIGWLEPLLNRLAHVPNTVAVPVLDRIDSKTLEYEETEASNSVKGGKTNNSRGKSRDSKTQEY